MKLLKNERAYRRWATDGWDTYKDRWMLEKPTEYPCFAYTYVSDWGMQELTPAYLYAADVQKMWVDIWRAGG